MDFRIALCTASLLFAQPAAAEEAFIRGVYSSPEGCAALKAKKQDDGDYLFLSATGLEGIEFNCEFVQVYPRKELPGWAAIGFCEEPGLSYPEIFSILPLDEKSLHLGTPDRGGGDEEADDATADDSTDDDRARWRLPAFDAGAK